MGAPACPPMPLIGLLLALVLAGVLMFRLLPSTPVAQPRQGAAPSPTPQTQAQKAAAAASQADRPRLKDALDGLNSNSISNDKP